MMFFFRSCIKHSQIIQQHQTYARCSCYAPKSQHNILCSIQFENADSCAIRVRIKKSQFFSRSRRLRNVLRVFFVQLTAAHYNQIAQILRMI